MGKKIIDIVTQRNTSQGRKSKGGGINQRSWNYIHPKRKLDRTETETEKISKNREKISENRKKISENRQIIENEGKKKRSRVEFENL